MRIIPLGTAAAFGSSAAGWTCTLIDNRLLIDAAPQAAKALRRLGLRPDDLEGVVITHLHTDHVFGFPFILAERSPELEPLRVLGPEGTEQRLREICAPAFSRAAPEKMSVTELPAGEVSKTRFRGYGIEAIPVEHTPVSLGYRIADSSGSVLGYAGDSGWCEGLVRIIAEANMAMVEMTNIEAVELDHLTLPQHLPSILEEVGDDTRVLLTHLGAPAEEYLEAMERLAAELPESIVGRLANLAVAEEFRVYDF